MSGSVSNIYYMIEPIFRPGEFAIPWTIFKLPAHLARSVIANCMSTNYMVYLGVFRDLGSFHFLFLPGHHLYFVIKDAHNPKVFFLPETSSKKDGGTSQGGISPVDCNLGWSLLRGEQAALFLNLEIKGEICIKKNSEQKLLVHVCKCLV